MQFQYSYSSQYLMALTLLHQGCHFVLSQFPLVWFTFFWSWLDKTGGFIIKYNIEVSRGLLEVRLTVIRPTRNREQPLAKKAMSPERADRKPSVPIAGKNWGLERGNMLSAIKQGTKTLCLPRPSLVCLLYVWAFYGKVQPKVLLLWVLSANANSCIIRCLQ